jgi:hypothetical protein
MQDPSSKAAHYRKEAVKCHELAKAAPYGFLADFYRRIAVRYLFMAEEEVRQAEKNGDAAADQGKSQAARPNGIHGASRVDLELLARWAGRDT